MNTVLSAFATAAAELYVKGVLRSRIKSFYDIAAVSSLAQKRNFLPPIFYWTKPRKTSAKMPIMDDELRVNFSLIKSHSCDE